jgi:hypothetical protein
MILTIAPGLYEINFGFFSSKQPTIQVLVNGEPILSAVNSSSYVIHHSAGKLKQTGKQHYFNGAKTVSGKGCLVFDHFGEKIRCNT